MTSPQSSVQAHQRGLVVGAIAIACIGLAAFAAANPSTYQTAASAPADLHDVMRQSSPLVDARMQREAPSGVVAIFGATTVADHVRGVQEQHLLDHPCEISPFAFDTYRDTLFLCFHERTGECLGTEEDWRKNHVSLAERSRGMTEMLVGMGELPEGERVRCEEESTAVRRGLVKPEDIADIRAHRDRQRRYYTAYMTKHVHIERPEGRGYYGGTFYCALRGTNQFLGTASAKYVGAEHDGASNAAETVSRVMSRLRDLGQTATRDDITCCGSYHSEADYFVDHPEVKREGPIVEAADR